MNDLSDIARILLDTNAFFYFINNDSALSKTAKNLLQSEIELLITRRVCVESPLNSAYEIERVW